MFATRDSLVVMDADGTLVDSFHAVAIAFDRHGMDIGDEQRFQRRRKLFKYLGGLREFPRNLRQQFGKQSRRRLIETLTDVYRQEAVLYPGMARAVRRLMEIPTIRIGVITRNVSHEPAETMRQLFRRHDICADRLAFLRCIPLSDSKLDHFRQIRRSFGVNPARAYACGDEHRDYEAAIGAGMHPFVAAYGFEDFDRLRRDYGVPEEVIARTPGALAERLCHALDVELPGAGETAG